MRCCAYATVCAVVCALLALDALSSAAAEEGAAALDRFEEQRPPMAPYIYDHIPPAVHMDTARCYSCMSRLYEAVWPSLRGVYRPPRNFTDACDDVEQFGALLPVVHCPTICVSMSEEPNIAGIRIRGHIRGCMSDVLINGFNQTIVSRYRWMHRDSCRRYPKKLLFKLPDEFSDESFIEVCTCYDDHCNGTASGASLRLSLLLFSAVASLFLWPSC